MVRDPGPHDLLFCQLVKSYSSKKIIIREDVDDEHETLLVHDIATSVFTLELLTYPYTAGQTL
jgi:hypothetical protein